MPSTDCARIDGLIRNVVGAGAERSQFDVMDEHGVPNRAFGPDGPPGSAPA